MCCYNTEVVQWRIQVWAVGAAAPLPPIDQKLGLVTAARLRQGANFHLNP